MNLEDKLFELVFDPEEKRRLLEIVKRSKEMECRITANAPYLISRPGTLVNIVGFAIREGGDIMILVCIEPQNLLLEAKTYIYERCLQLGENYMERVNKNFITDVHLYHLEPLE